MSPETTNNLSISVIIPTHNRPESLSKAVRSILKQKTPPKELIVVDDGSEPPVSPQIFSVFKNSLDVRLLRNEVSKGGNYARNKGIIEATGEWVAFLDDDDVFMPEKIEEVTRALSNHSSIGLLYHTAEINLINEKIRYKSGVSNVSSTQNPLSALLIRNFIGGTSMVVAKRRMLIELGGFDETMPALQDWEMWIRVTKAGKRLVYLNKALTKYVHNTGQQSITINQEKVNKAYEMLKYKYANDYAELSEKERGLFEQGRLKNTLFKSLLCRDRKAALIAQYSLFKTSCKIRDLLPLLIIPWSFTMVFRIRYLQNKLTGL